MLTKDKIISALSLIIIILVSLLVYLIPIRKNDSIVYSSLPSDHIHNRHPVLDYARTGKYINATTPGDFIRIQNSVGPK